MKEFLINQVLPPAITIIVFGFISFYIQKRLQDKAAPKVAAAVLRTEDYTKNQKDAYLQAVNIIMRDITHRFFPSINQTPIGEKPTAVEINDCQIKLYIYSTNGEIQKQYKKILKLNSWGAAIQEIAKLYELIGRELGNKNLAIDFKEFEFIMPQNPSSSPDTSTRQ